MECVKNLPIAGSKLIENPLLAQKSAMSKVRVKEIKTSLTTRQEMTGAKKKGKKGRRKSVSGGAKKGKKKNQLDSSKYDGWISKLHKYVWRL